MRCGGDRNSPRFKGRPESREQGPRREDPRETQPHDLRLSILPFSPSSQCPVKYAWARLSSPGPVEGGEGHGLCPPLPGYRELGSSIIAKLTMDTHLEVLGSPG